jgi:hypothetical protein
MKDDNNKSSENKIVLKNTKKLQKKWMKAGGTNQTIHLKRNIHTLARLGKTIVAKQISTY